MKRFIIKIMEFLTLFYAVMLVGTIIVDQLAYTSEKIHI